MALRNLLGGRSIPYIMGFPAYGGGPFERFGIPTTPSLIVGFLFVCLVECIAGYKLWGGQKAGAIIAISLLPAGAIYWWGFALPIPPILAIIRTLLLISNWQNLK